LAEALHQYWRLTRQHLLNCVAMIAIMWQFDVKRGHELEFEQLYGADGEWTAMNRQSRSYLGSSFLRDQNRPSRYVIVEYWSEMIVYEQHRTYRSDAIASFEERRTMIVESTEPLGIFTALNVPDRFGPTWSQRG
jgi:quinol monooxygenase YgiN